MTDGRSSHGGRRHTYLLVLAASGLLAVSACTGPGADQAAQVAETFDRLAVSDAGQACDLLAPGTRDEVEKAAQQPCSEALGQEDLPDPSPLLAVDVYGHDAVVRFGNDTVFLARFPEGWRVTAAGCRPGPSDDRPYACDVSGG